MEIQDFIDKVNQKIDSELLWCGGDRNKSSEMKNWRKAYSDVKKWMKELSKEINQLDDENLNDNKMEQTAVEWFADEITKRGPTENNPPQWLIKLYEQANEMFEQQIINAWTDAKYCNTIGNEINYKDGEQYYNETFKQQEQ